MNKIATTYLLSYKDYYQHVSRTFINPNDTIIKFCTFIIKMWLNYKEVCLCGKLGLNS